MDTKQWLPILLSIALNSILLSAELSCKDMDGKDVDWFIALKMPKLKGYDDVHPNIKDGTAFYYADSNNQDFRISKANVNDPKSAIGYTVTQAIDAHVKGAKDIMYAFYNDQPPAIKVNGEDTKHKELGSKAHAKGVMSFNSKQGFWLLHSAPRFNDPTQGKGYFYPNNAMPNGQSFFCGTFLNDQLEQIAPQIFTSNLGIYVQSLPLDMAKKFPRLYHALVMGKSVTGTSKCPFYRNSALKTKGGQWLQNYEKNTLTQADLWANQVTEDKQQSFLVETWLNGPRDWKNVCGGKFFTKNIRSLKHELGNVKWRSRNDHSKWAVSDKPSTVCIGDINRQCSQTKRGGGTMCIDNDKIWKFFRDSVDVIECCPDEKGPNCEKMPGDSITVPAANRKPGDPEFLCPKQCAKDAQGNWQEDGKCVHPNKDDEVDVDTEGDDSDDSDSDKPAKKTPVKKSPSNSETPAKKTPAKKSPAKKSPAKKSPAKSDTPAKKGRGKQQKFVMNDLPNWHVEDSPMKKILDGLKQKLGY